MDEALNKLAAYLGDRLGTKLLASEVALGELTIEVERDSDPRNDPALARRLSCAASAA